MFNVILLSFIYIYKFKLKFHRIILKININNLIILLLINYTLNPSYIDKKNGIMKNQFN